MRNCAETELFMHFPAVESICVSVIKNSGGMISAKSFHNLTDVEISFESVTLK